MQQAVISSYTAPIFFLELILNNSIVIISNFGGISVALPDLISSVVLVCDTYIEFFVSFSFFIKAYSEILVSLVVFLETNLKF